MKMPILIVKIHHSNTLFGTNTTPFTLIINDFRYTLYEHTTSKLTYISLGNILIPIKMDDIINQIPFNTWFLNELEFYKKKKKKSVTAYPVEKKLSYDLSR